MERKHRRGRVGRNGISIPFHADEEDLDVPEVEPEEGPLVPLEELITDIEEPAESIYIEKQRRLLSTALNSSWKGPGRGKSFLICADVGLFPESRQTALSPDIMLGVDVKFGEGLQRPENRSWFVWLRGKVPDLIMEFVSDRRGGEATWKFKKYAKLGVQYYVIYDPTNRLKNGVLRSFVLRHGTYELLDRPWFPALKLGLTFWKGTYENWSEEWLRWCDAKGKVIPTGGERAEKERRRARRAKLRANEERKERQRLEARLRSLGIDPAT